jgi:hypothetical protein
MGEVALLSSEALLNFFAANPELQAHLAASSPSSFTASSSSSSSLATSTARRPAKRVPEFSQLPTEVWERIFLYMGVAGVAKMRALSSTCARIGASVLERGGTTTDKKKRRSRSSSSVDLALDDDGDEDDGQGKDKKGKEKAKAKADHDHDDDDEEEVQALLKRDKQKRRRGEGLWEPHMRDSILARARTATIEQWAALSRNNRLWRSVRGCPATKRRLLQALQDFFHHEETSMKWPSLFRSSGAERSPHAAAVGFS